jgi:hypothetical protein
MDLRSEGLPAKPAAKNFDTNYCPSIWAYALMTTNNQSCHSNPNAFGRPFEKVLLYYLKVEFILTGPWR